MKSCRQSLFTLLRRLVLGQGATREPVVLGPRSAPAMKYDTLKLNDAAFAAAAAETSK